MIQRSIKFRTKIFLDSGDPLETKEAIELLGFLDGQTTNPTLIGKNPEVKRGIESGNKFKLVDIYNLYKKIIQGISRQIPNGSVSIEVYADLKTKAEKIVEDARKLSTWIPNAHIKIPITKEGLKAANKLIKEGININMTLCFNQRQAVAVYSATKGAKDGQVFISPFIGRLDDIEKNGIDLVANILKVYKKGDGHVKVVAASIRNLSHLVQCLKLSCDIVTAPLEVLKEWKKTGFSTKDDRKLHKTPLERMPYETFSPSSDWKEISLKDALTDKGVKKFCADWDILLN